MFLALSPMHRLPSKVIDIETLLNVYSCSTILLFELLNSKIQLSFLNKLLLSQNMTYGLPQVAFVAYSLTVTCQTRMQILFTPCSQCWCANSRTTFCFDSTYLQEEMNMRKYRYCNWETEQHSPAIWNT